VNDGGADAAAGAAADDDAAQALASGAEAGIHCLRIPTPFMVGRVNTYLIEDDPLTLVDSGPNSGKALDELERALAAHGRAIEDLGLLIVSHQHMDHMGLASILARRSGAEVAALDRLAPFLEHYGDDMERDDEFAERLMLRHGIPDELVGALRAVSAGFRAWGAGVQVTRLLADGSDLTLRDRTLRVLHRPGHSPSDTVFYDAQRSIMLAADHLIKHVSSNPLISRPLGHQGEDDDLAGSARPRALLTYLRSMQATREMEIELILSGHGDPITDHRRLIDERVGFHERRAERILGVIEQRPATAYEIAQHLWGNVAVTQAFLTLSEVLGHVDLLLERQLVREVDEEGVIRFEAARG
jgi:glyoxylase-like metal-dependent hydrolase (beta-lactamase superfamily II)